MSTLKNTPFEFIYILTFSNNDQQFINHFSILMYFGMVMTVFQNLKTPLPYGKMDNSNSNKKTSGLSINSKFAFRYAFLPTVVMPFVIYYFTPAQQLWNICNLFAVSLLTIHYINRSIIYTSKMSPSATPTPLLIFLMLTIFGTMNSFVQTHHLLNILSVQASPLTILGMILSITGMWLNIHHDNILTDLRSNSKDKSGKREYKIPQGFLFEYISCANYFGELVEWWGLFLVTLAGPQMVLAGFSTVFLVLRARYSHEFYKQRFGKAYPSSRKAIIPFIY